MSRKLKDCFIIGFALFSMFFGAGNLIFPPTLGLQSGAQWATVALGFVTTGVGLTLLGLIAIGKLGGDIDKLTEKLGKNCGIAISVINILAIGPLLAIPRTAATTYEIITYGSNFSASIFVTIFFIIVLAFVLTPGDIIDKLGKYLTPILLIILFVIIIKGVIIPLGTPRVFHSSGMFLKGFEEGYHTMDALASIMFASIAMVSIKARGYKKGKEQLQMVALSSIVAGVSLAVIYTGLVFIGATVSSTIPTDIGRVDLLVTTTNMLLGAIGQYTLSAAIALACLTTAIGLTSTCSEYFSNLTKGKIDARIIAIMIVVFSGFFAVSGVDKIVIFAIPLLTVLYPIIITLIILSYFDNYIKYKSLYKGAVLGALLVSSIQAFSNLGPILNPVLEKFSVEAFDFASALSLLNEFPLNQYGFPWIVPAVVLGIVFMLVEMIKRRK